MECPALVLRKPWRLSMCPPLVVSVSDQSWSSPRRCQTGCQMCASSVAWLKRTLQAAHRGRDRLHRPHPVRILFLFEQDPFRPALAARGPVDGGPVGRVLADDGLSGPALLQLGLEVG